MEMTFYASLLPSPKIEPGLQKLHTFVSPSLIRRILSGRFGPNIREQPPHFTIGEGFITITILYDDIKNKNKRTHLLT